MFRKTPEAIRDWSPEFVAGCAVRQTAILDTAARLVRPGGWLCYATCTFASEENETIIARFLEAHPDFELLPLPSPFPLFSSPPPLPSSPLPHPPLRLYPHRAAGEGHFIALLQRKLTNPQTSTPANQQMKQSANHPQASLRSLLPHWQTFSQQTLNLRVDPAQLRLVKSYLYALPPLAPNLSGLNVIRPGWWLGSFKKDRFEPSHALAMGLVPHEAQHSLTLDEPTALAYLRRETLRLNPLDHPNGWTLVMLDSFPLGWGKMVRGVLKNHYPAGLRLGG